MKCWGKNQIFTCKKNQWFQSRYDYEDKWNRWIYSETWLESDQHGWENWQSFRKIEMLKMGEKALRNHYK